MTLPEFNEIGDLPPGLHQATLDEIVRRFGAAQGQRSLCTRRLLHVYTLAQRTGWVQRFIIFGSYVSARRDGPLVRDRRESYLWDDAQPALSPPSVPPNFGGGSGRGGQGVRA